MIGSHLKRSKPVISLSKPHEMKVSINREQEDKKAHDLDLAQGMPTLQESFNPLAIMLMGPRGKGKTLAMTTLGRMLTYAYRDKGFEGYKTYANYPCDVVDVADGLLLQKLNDPRNHTIKNGLLLIDEIGTAAASTKWNTNENFSLNQFLVQLRKSKLEIVFTTQYPRGLDRGTLEQIDLFVECRKIKDYGIAFAVHDWKDAFIPQPKRKRPWPPFWHEADWFYSWFGTQHTFNHYSTDAHVIPLYMRDSFAAATSEEWRRLGYKLEGVDEDEDLLPDSHYWDQTNNNRVDDISDLEVDWIEMCELTREFEIKAMFKEMEDILPEDARTINKFTALLIENDFVIDKENGRARSEH
jgi:hypothetical protein|tara:strand:+ start:1422 stop:2486 length:1065 start_codon:yes stop_codon:yes gene_type:complete